MFKVRHDFFVYEHNMTRTGECQYDLISTVNSQLIVVFTELLKNPGPSVTNAIESIIPQFCRQNNLDPKEVIFIERYQSHPDDLDVINYQQDGTTSWIRLPADQARSILEII